MKSIFVIGLMLVTVSTTSPKLERINHDSYKEYESLVKDIPSAQGLVDINKKMDELKIKVDSLKNNE